MAEYNTLTGLNSAAVEVRDEKDKLANTATRIGSLFKGIINYFAAQIQTLTAVSTTASIATSANVQLSLVGTSVFGNNTSFFILTKSEFANEDLGIGSIVFLKNQTAAAEIGIYQIAYIDVTYYYCTRLYTYPAINKVYVQQGSQMGTWHKDGNGVNVSFVRITDKANSADVYTKTATDALLNVKEDVANKISDATTATAPATQYPNVSALTAYVAAQIDALKAGAPQVYDTLKEIADKLASDDNVAAALSAQIAGKVSLTGDETVSGIKSFSSAVKALSGILSNAGIISTGLSAAPTGIGSYALTCWNPTYQAARFMGYDGTNYQPTALGKMLANNIFQILLKDGNIALNLGNDAAGDMYYRGGDGYLKKIAKGTDGQALTLASGVPAWGTIASASAISGLSYLSFKATGSVSNSAAGLSLLQYENTGASKLTLSNSYFSVLETGYYLLNYKVFVGALTTDALLRLSVWKDSVDGANYPHVASFDLSTTKSSNISCSDYIYLETGHNYYVGSLLLNASSSCSVTDSRFVIINPRYSGGTSASTTRNYLTAYVAATTLLSLTSSYSKLSLLQTLWEDGTNMLTSTYTLTDNRIVCSSAGKKRVSATISLIGSSSEIGVTAAIRKYNVAKYANYRVEAEAKEYTKDAFGCTINISADVQIAAEEASVTGLEFAIKTATSTTLTVSYCRITVEDLTN